MPINGKKLPRYSADASVIMKGRDLNDLSTRIEQTRVIPARGLLGNQTADGLVLSADVRVIPAYTCQLIGHKILVHHGTTSVMGSSGVFNPIPTKYGTDLLTTEPPPLIATSGGEQSIWIKFSETESFIVQETTGTDPEHKSDEYIIEIFRYEKSGITYTLNQLRTGDIEIVNGGRPPFTMHSPIETSGGGWTVQVEPGFIISTNPKAPDGTALEYFMPTIAGVELDAVEPPTILVNDGIVVCAKIERDDTGVVVGTQEIVAVSESTANESAHYVPFDEDNEGGEDETFQYRKLFTVSIPEDESPVASRVWQASDIELTPALWTPENIGTGSKVWKKYDKENGKYQFRTLTDGDVTGRRQIQVVTDNGGKGDTIKIQGNNISQTLFIRETNGDVLYDHEIATCEDGLITQFLSKMKVISMEVCVPPYATGDPPTVETRKFITLI